MKTWPSDFVQTVVTSPPYWGLRDYGVEGQIGLEESPEAFVDKMVEVFREVRRILRPDGTCWMNLGDSYYNYRPGSEAYNAQSISQKNRRDMPGQCAKRGSRIDGLKEKDLVGAPWRAALALQADGWYLRSDIIWHKPNPMPESVTDRPGKAHEYIFLLSKSPRYFYDIDAVREKTGNEWSFEEWQAAKGSWKPPETNEAGVLTAYAGQNKGEAGTHPLGRNKRTVWSVPAMSSGEAHFATFPPDLIKPCIMAGTSEHGACACCGTPYWRDVEASGGTIGESWHDHENDLERGQRCGNKAEDGTYKREFKGWKKGCECATDEIVPCIVFDPFMGAGTTALVSSQLNRQFLGTELNPEYAKIAERRIAGEVAQLKMF